MKILIADDEKISREGIRDCVNWSKYDMEVVYCAKDGKEALDYISEHPIDVLITDIRMPVIDGLDLIRQIHNKNTDISVIIVSGYDDFSYAQKAIQFGVSEYLLKPFSIEELVNVLCSISEKRAQNISRIHVDSKEKESFDDSSRGLFNEIGEEIVAALRENDRDMMKNHSKRMYDLFTINGYSLELYKRMMIKSIHMIVQKIQKLIDYDLVYFNDAERLMEIADVQNGRDVKERYELFLNEIFDYMDMIEDEHSGSLVRRTKQIVLDKYSDKEMTLNNIAERLSVTPNYLGRLFKQQSGTAFSDYVEQVRMMQAQKLLKETNKKIYEVASECGYNDGQYFAKAFKKYTGKTPNRFRNDN